MDIQEVYKVIDDIVKQLQEPFIKQSEQNWSRPVANFDKVDVQRTIKVVTVLALFQATERGIRLLKTKALRENLEGRSGRTTSFILLQIHHFGLSILLNEKLRGFVSADFAACGKALQNFSSF